MLVKKSLSRIFSPLESEGLSIFFYFPTLLHKFSIFQHFFFGSFLVDNFPVVNSTVLLCKRRHSVLCILRSVINCNSPRNMVPRRLCVVQGAFRVLEIRRLALRYRMSPGIRRREVYHEIVSLCICWPSWTRVFFEDRRWLNAQCAKTIKRPRENEEVSDSQDLVDTRETNGRSGRFKIPPDNAC